MSPNIAMINFSMTQVSYERLHFINVLMRLILHLLAKARYDSSRSMAEHGVTISYMSGTINATEQRAFEKLIFRMSRGKVLTRFHERNFELKEFDGPVKIKTVFVLVFQEG